MRAWGMLGGAALGFLLLLWAANALLRGGDEPAASPTGATGPTGGRSAEPYASPPPPGSVEATFPRSAEGTRLIVKVVGLGDHPEACTAEGLRIGAEVRSVYHHRCASTEEIDRAFFLVEVTNRSDGRVPISLDGFTVVDVGGEAHEALSTPPVGAPATRFFPPEIVLGSGATTRRWVTIDASDGDRPDRLVYTDGPERLTIRFRGTWA